VEAARATQLVVANATLWEGGVLRLELLHHGGALNEPRHDLLDLGIQFTIVGLRILLRVPQTDRFHLPLFQRHQQQFIQELENKPSASEASGSSLPA
jgi:hypothetical protein